MLTLHHFFPLTLHRLQGGMPRIMRTRLPTQVYRNSVDINQNQFLSKHGNVLKRTKNMHRNCEGIGDD